MAWNGKESKWHGMEWKGKVRHGMVNRHIIEMARKDKACQGNRKERHDKEWHGKERHGMAWHGKVRKCMACKERKGMAWHGQGNAWNGKAWNGMEMA
jgi:hypothetical protein